MLVASTYRKCASPHTFDALQCYLFLSPFYAPRSLDWGCVCQHHGYLKEASFEPPEGSLLTYEEIALARGPASSLLPPFAKREPDTGTRNTPNRLATRPFAKGLGVSRGLLGYAIAIGFTFLHLP
jgi:hypothetical protein